MKEIFSAVENVLNIKVPLKICSRREGDPAKLVANSAKAKEMLQWSAKTPLNVSIQNAANWERILKTLQQPAENKERTHI